MLACIQEFTVVIIDYGWLITLKLSEGGNSIFRLPYWMLQKIFLANMIIFMQNLFYPTSKIMLVLIFERA